MALEDTKAILLSCPGDLLTAIWVSATFDALKKKFAGTRLYLLVKKANASIFSEHPALDGLLTLTPETKIEDIAQYFKRLQIDTLVHAVYDERVALAGTAAAIENTFAFAEKKSSEIKAKTLVERSRDFDDEHPVFHSFELLAPLGISVPAPAELKLNLSVSNTERHDLFEKLKRYDMNFDSHYAVVCLDAGRNGHFVDVQIFAKAAKYLHDLRKDLPIILVSFEGKNAKTSRRMIDFVSRASGINLVNFFLLEDKNDELSPAQVAELLKHADICIATDNAVAYLANFEQCPLVTLVVDPRERRYFPRAIKSEVVYTSAQKIPWFELPGFFHWRASHSFSIAKIRDAVDYVLSF